MAQDGQGASKRPRIQLPSLKEVQAAQRSKAAPNYFASRQTGRSDGGEGAQLPRQEATGGLPAGHAAAQQSRQSSGPPPSARPPEAHTMPRIPGSAGTWPSTQQNAGSGGPAGPAAHHGAASGGLPSSRAAAGPPSSSFPISYPCGGGLVDYKAMNISPNAVLVSKRQEGNPLLKFVRNVHIAYADIVPDYIMGADTCALFLSMRFHLLKPDYIHHRIKELQRSFRLRVLVCHVDIDDVIEPLQQITRAALLNDFTLICGWTPEECARYLETLKVYETKPPDAILGRTDEDYLSRLNAALTTVRGVNRTDVLTLGTTFGTAARTMQASVEELSACAGIGPTKVKRLYDAFHEPFRKTLQPVQAASVPAAPDQAKLDGAEGKSGVPTL